MVKIIVVGDVHAKFSGLNDLINKEGPDIIISTGDFGYWPKFPYIEQVRNINTKKTKILWCDGNHEDHWGIREVMSYTLQSRIPAKIAENVYYIPRGTIYQLEDGRKVLFMGGAFSIDKAYRELGVDWFPEETISYGDLHGLPDEKVDIIISHTGPTEFVDKCKMFFDVHLHDPSEEALSQLLKIYKPDLWYFSHFHKYNEGVYENTRWFCLNQLPQPGWWTTLHN